MVIIGGESAIDINDALKIKINANSIKGSKGNEDISIDIDNDSISDHTSF